MVVEGGLSGARRLNAMVLGYTVGNKTITLDAGDATPITARIVGAVSLISWLGVLYWGRMMPFRGNSF